MRNMSLPSSFGTWFDSIHNAPTKITIATSAASARFQYVPRRRDATRSSRSTIGKKIIVLQTTPNRGSGITRRQDVGRRDPGSAFAGKPFPPPRLSGLKTQGGGVAEIVQQLAPRPIEPKVKIVRQTDSKPQ